MRGRGEDIVEITDWVEAACRRLRVDVIQALEGRKSLTAAELRQLKAVMGLVERCGVTKVSHVVRDGGDDVRIPARFLEAYELLVDRVYGPSGMQGLGNEVQIHGLGRGSWRVSSGKSETRNGAIPKKNLSGRSVVKNATAFEFKRKVDARLGRLAHEIELWLENGGEGVVGAVGCRTCGKMNSRDWRFCPFCGGNNESE